MKRLCLTLLAAILLAVPMFAQDVGAMLGLNQTFTADDVFSNGAGVGPIPFSGLSGLPTSGTFHINLIVVSDAVVGSSPCTGGGTGSLAAYVDGAWSCAFGAGSGGNATTLLSETWAAPGAIGSGTPNSVAATTITSTGNATFGTANGAQGVGSQVSSNTDLNGELTQSSGASSYTFVGSYSVHPICVASDETSIAPVKVTYTGATVVNFTTTGSSDVIGYLCLFRD
jgi:hypothetical protein